MQWKQTQNYHIVLTWIWPNTKEYKVVILTQGTWPFTVNRLGMKGRKYVIDTLEDKTNETQEKISSLRKWNCTELGMLEAKEVNLEASLIEVKSKNEELKARAEEKVQQITNIKGI